GILQTFLDNRRDIFNRLTSHEQLFIRNILKERVEEAVRNRLTTLHSSLLEDLFKRNCYDYLVKISNPFATTPEVIIESMVSKIDQENGAEFFTDNDRKVKPQDIQKAIHFLKTSAFASLKAVFVDAISRTAETVRRATFSQMLSVLAINKMS